MGRSVSGYELQRRLDEVLGESTDEQWAEGWSEYTGSNALFHMLADTGHDALEDYRTNVELVGRDGGVYVEGLGLFKKVDFFDDNYDSYEQRADTNLVFEFEGNTYRVKGWLDSHLGGTWGSIEKVSAVEKTITVWETV